MRKLENYKVGVVRISFSIKCRWDVRCFKRQKLSLFSSEGNKEMLNCSPTNVVTGRNYEEISARSDQKASRTDRVMKPIVRVLPQ